MMISEPSAGCSRGYITVAHGNPMYLEMAVDLALSLKSYQSDPIALVADTATARIAEREYAGVFHTIAPLGEDFRVGRCAKFGVGEATPFDRTLFIDADVLVLSPLDQLWGSLEPADFAMMGELLREDSTVVHAGSPVAHLIQQFKLDHYFKNHSGAFYFRRDPGCEILRECRGVYAKQLYTLKRRLLTGWVADELAFGVVGGRHSFEGFPRPYPMYWTDELKAMTRGDSRKPLCHFIATPAAEALDWLMEGVCERRRLHGFRVESEHWRRKVAKSTMAGELGRKLLRVGRLALRVLTGTVP